MAKNLGINIKIGADLKKFSSDMQNVSRQMKRTGKKMKGIGKSMALNFTAPLALIGGAMIKMASDTEESLNKVEVAFGSSSQQVKDFANTTLKSFGVARGSALEMASTFGDMATSMGINQSAAAGMSTKLVGLAGDLASFKNIRIDVAQTALNSIFTGETESLKKLGIVMTQANLSAFALEQGITKPIKAMSEGEKVMLRYNFVMAKTANAHGDFERTGGGAANQMRIFQEGLKQLAEEFGNLILPMFTKLVNKLNKVVTWFGTLSDQQKKNILIFGAIVAAIGPIIYIMGTLVTSLGAVTSAFGTAKIASTLAMGAWGLAGVAAIGLVVGMDKLNKTLFDNHPLTKRTVKLTDGLKESTDNLKKQIEELNTVNESGVVIDKATRESLKLKTERTMEDTAAKLQNAIATREQMKAEMEAQLSATLAQTRGVGMQGEFIGADMAAVNVLKANIASMGETIQDANNQLHVLHLTWQDLGKVKDVSIGKMFGGGDDDAADDTAKRIELVSMKAKQGTKDLEPFKETTKEVGEAIKGLAYDMNETDDSFSRFFLNVGQLKESFIDLAEGFLASGVTDVFESLGTSMVNGADEIDNLGTRILGNLGEFLGTFGKMLISAGIASLALFESLFAGPVGAAVAIGAGIALVAASGAIKSHVANVGSSTSGGGGTSSYTPPTYSGTGTGSNVITLETVVYGNDIVLSSNRQHGTVSRTRRK